MVLKNKGKAANVQDSSAMQAQRPKRNIKSTLVEPFKQIRFGLYVISISLGFVVIAAGLFIRAFVDQYQHVMGIFNIVDPSLKWELVTNDVFITNGILLAVSFILFIVVMFIAVFVFTHRYYGPLVSIERFIEQISNGQYFQRVTIRNKDELQRLVGKLNKMADILEKRHGKQV